MAAAIVARFFHLSCDIFDNLLRLGAGAATIGLEATAAEACFIMLLELLLLALAAVDLLINFGCLGAVQSPTRAVARDAALPAFQTL